MKRIRRIYTDFYQLKYIYLFQIDSQTVKLIMAIQF